MTTAVLLPLRLETRFDGNKLRLRVIPDEPWFDRHDPLPSAAELRSLERFLAVAGDDHKRPEARGAWRVFAAEHGPGRAAWLVRTFPPDPGLGSGRVARPDRLREDSLFTELVDFPDQLQVWLARGGERPAHATTLLLVDPSKRRMDPGDPDDPEERRWWESWDVAVEAGLATEIDLGERTDDIDALYVVGLGSMTPATLFARHRDAGRLGLLAPGTPTNTVNGAAAADLGQDPMPWLELLHRSAVPRERQISLALTGDRELLGPLPGDPRPHQTRARLLLTGLWPALCGHTLTDVLGLGQAVDRVAAWAANNVDPLGPYPTLRVGSQPYGLLPATSVADWVPAEDDPPAEDMLRGPLVTLRARWAEAARSSGRGTVHGASAEHLLELLARPPASPGYALRRMHPTELWFTGLLGTNHAITWPGLIAEWERTYPLVAELGIRPRRRYSARGTHHSLQLPLVTPIGLSEGEIAGGLLGSLVRLAGQTPTAFASTRTVTEAVGQRLSSLLLRLAVYSLQVALGDIGRHKLGVPAGTLDPVAARPDVPQVLSEWIRAVTPDDLAADTEPAIALRRLTDALETLGEVPDTDLERVLPATIDCASHRIDPWVVGIARRRLQSLSSRPPRLGGYGWVDRPRPGRPGPTAGGLLPAPSHPQALTAALIRDRAINDPEPGRWHMDVTSDRVRRAARLADEVRGGAHPAEVLGREVERAVGDPITIETLRDLFPIRDEHRGRRVCDGQRVLAANLAPLRLPVDVLDELARLREAVEVYADLLVAEAVHHVVDGRAALAGAALDAAAGLARPPVLDVLQTRRDGRAVQTTCLTALPDVTAPSLPDDPLALAETRPARVGDPATAALLIARLGPASQWRWQLSLPDGTTATIRLADLGLEPADALALPLGTLERLLTETASGSGTTVTDRDGGIRYERAVRLVALLGRIPAVAEDTTETPTAIPADATGAEVAELRERLGKLRAIAHALTDRLTAASGAGADERRAVLRLATGWGIAPEPDPAAVDPLADQIHRAHRQLQERLAAAPDDAAAEALDPAGLAAAIAALSSPTGQIAILGRLRRDALPPLHDVAAVDSDGGGLNTAWLSHVAPVRPPLARLEAFQLAAGTPAGSGPPWTPWTNRPADPWQTDPEDNRRLVVAYAPPDVNLAEAAPDRILAVGLLDRFAETIPSAEHTATAAFGFDAPGARAPQAILLAVPPDPDRPLDEATLVSIVAETRELAHARMATPADLDEIAGVAPLPLLPATGDTSSGLEI
ncbi:hypothetical protein SAMN05660657_04401 [Geodermatophilus amargosae]|uniref:Uncharacterized protein n=1 Tax=Geodermatophilus amargosae TaxID=1296565 RepID=A0A1I7CFG3_9ACTN|nr:hypothetical protein [Geodermatophilus amargosae]SFT98154.1 hypothetical protein SAMN05660657_04401 [Geodermatophilus amargosae]